MDFVRTSSGAWVADVGHIHCYCYQPQGPDTASLALAQAITGSIELYVKRARDYLDLFIDREKACGRQKEEWTFLEMELGCQPSNGRPFARLAFDLLGDDGGYWTVHFREVQQEIRPYQFDRMQG